MDDNYSKAYKEVIEILKYLPKESVEKIPNDILETYKTKMSKNYEFSVDINKSFEEQELLEETKAIFANIFRDYWATPYQKEQIIAKEQYDRKKDEEIKKEKYDSDDIFNKKKNFKELKVNEITNLPIEVKEEKFFKKLIEFIKKLLSFNN